MRHKLAVSAAIAAAVTGTAFAQQNQSTSTGLAPSVQLTHFYVMNYYKQNVYDSTGVKLGEIADALVGKDGKVEGFIMSVSGLPGSDEKNVAVPFDAVKSSQQNGGMRLTMNTTKERIEKAPAFKLDNAFFTELNQNMVNGVVKPINTVTVANYYKQNVYDPSDAKIAEIIDVVVGQGGTIEAFIMSVGGFLGIAEKNVAVPFDAVKSSQQNGGMRLTMNTTKDQLQTAPGVKFDRAKAIWVPA